MSGTVTNPFAGVAHYVTPATAPSLQAESIMQDSHGNLIVTTTDGQIRVFLLSAASAPVLAASTAGTTSSNPFSANVARYAAVYTAPTIVGTATIDGQGNAVLTHLDGRTQVFKAPVGAPVTGPTYPIPVAGTVSIVVGDGRNTLTYADGALGGAAVIQRDLYEAASTSGPFTHAGTVTLGAGGTYLDFLSNGTLRAYYLTTTTLGGTSPPSNIVSGTPVAAVVITPPAAGTLATPVAGNGTVAHVYTAGATNGAAITGYTIYAGATEAACQANITSHTGSPLTLGTGGTFSRTVANGTTEWIAVTATNTAGEGLPSNFAWGEPQAAAGGGGTSAPLGPDLTVQSDTAEAFTTGKFSGTQALATGNGTATLTPTTAGTVAAGFFFKAPAFPSGTTVYPVGVNFFTDTARTQNQTGLYIKPDGTIGIAHFGQFQDTGIQVADNSWHYLSFRVDQVGNGIQFQLDGVQRVGAGLSGTIPSGPLYFDVNSISASLGCEICEVVVYDGQGPITHQNDGQTSFTPPTAPLSISTANVLALWRMNGNMKSGNSTGTDGAGPPPTQGTAPAASGGGAGGGGGGGSSGSGVSTSAAASALSITYTGPIIRGTGTVPSAYTVPSAIPVQHYSASGTLTGYLTQSMPGFARSALLPGQKLVYTKNGSSTQIEVQVDEGGRWLNGSRRTAITTWPLDTSSGTLQQGTVQVVSGTPNTTPHMTVAQIVTALSTNDVQIRTDGRTWGDGRQYVTSLHDIMTTYAQGPVASAFQAGQWELWQSGPYKVSIRAWQCLKDSTSGAFHKWRIDTIYAEFRYDGHLELSGASEQPWYNGAHPAGTINSNGTVSARVSGDTQGRFVGAVEMWNGSTRVGAWGGSNDPRAATIAASTLFVDSSHTLGIPAGFDTSQVVSFAPASGGVLPTGITAGTPYWLSYNGGWHLAPYAAAIENYQNGYGSIVSWGTAVSGGSAGSGNIVFTPLVATYAGTRTAYAAPNCLPIPVGFTPPSVQVAWDEDYMAKGALLWPAFDPASRSVRFTSAQQSFTAKSWYPNQRPFGNWINATGDNPGDSRIGPVTQTAVKALLSPFDAQFVQHALGEALGWADQAMWWRDPASGRVWVHDNGPDDNGTIYPGLSTGYPSSGLGNYSDGTWVGPAYGGADWSAYTDGYGNSAFDASHQPRPWAVPAFLTGRAIFFDQGWAHAGANAMSNGNQATQTVGGSTFYNVFFPSQQSRGAGWSLAASFNAEAFTPADKPEAAYLRHMNDSSAAWAGAYAATTGPEMALGFLVPAGQTVGSSANGTQQYQNDIKFIGVALHARAGERAGWLAYLNKAATFTAGYANDANPAGGTGALAGAGYDIYPYGSDPSNRTLVFSSIRAVIAGTSDYGNLTPPFPTTGFVNSNAPYTTVSAYQAVGYAAIKRAALTLGYDCGVISPAGDDCGQVLTALNTRFTTAPNISAAPMFSSSNWGSSSYPGNLDFLSFALQPG